MSRPFKKPPYRVVVAYRPSDNTNITVVDVGNNAASSAEAVADFLENGEDRADWADAHLGAIRVTAGFQAMQDDFASFYLSAGLGTQTLAGSFYDFVKGMRDLLKAMESK